MGNPNTMAKNVVSGTPVYTLGIASKLSEIPSHSIRQYIDKGLLIPYKLDSKRHLFSPIDINRLKHIHVLIHEKGLNFAGIRALMAMVPCWAIRNCSKSDRKSCSAPLEDAFPCWESSNKGTACRNVNCRECNVYKRISEEVNMKSVISDLI